ncbi:MAG: thioredoxin domain-containing protein [Cyanophyceae cyanobacterium]
MSIYAARLRSLFTAIAAALIVFGIYLTSLSSEGTASRSELATMAAMVQQSVDYEIALRDNQPTLIEFYADWCTTCRSLAPVLSKLHQETEAVDIVMLNVDEPRWTQQVKMYQVKGVPHLTFLNSRGEIVETLVGKVPETEIRQVVQHLS